MVSATAEAALFRINFFNNFAGENYIREIPRGHHLPARPSHVPNHEFRQHSGEGSETPH